MKKFALLVAIALSCISLTLASFFKTSKHPKYALQTGDIVFQDTGGAQGRAVKDATGSPYSHVGVIFEKEGEFHVLEAIQPVTITPLNKWKARSRIFHAMRLKDPSQVNQLNLKKATQWAEQQLGKNYDLQFRWDDETLYCSELVWKIYKTAGDISLCQPKPFQSYNLEKPSVQKIIRQRYGSLDNLPKNEPVVAPSDLARSSLLKEVPHQKKKASFSKK